jgi:lysophospholipase L1-like esterase
VAEAVEAVFIPFQQVMDEAARRAEPAYWAPDGVHPSPAGHALLAEAWMGRFPDPAG